MAALEDAVTHRGFQRVGLRVSVDGDGAPARALYATLGYRFAHGPMVTSVTLESDDGPVPVGGVNEFLVKEL